MLTLVLLSLVAAPDVIVIDSRGDGFRSTSTVNGFSTELMPSVQSITGTTTGYPSWEHRCVPLHPYFLKPGVNAVVLSYTFDNSLVEHGAKGPWTQSIEVLTSTLDDDAQPTSLVKQSGTPATRKDNNATKKLSASFNLPTTLPPWRWSSGAAIADTANVRASLYAEYQKLWKTLDEMPKATPEQREAFRVATRASTSEFIRASESRGKPFTFVDDLVKAAATLGLPGDVETVKSVNKDPPKPTAPTTIPAPSRPTFVHDEEPDRGPNVGNHLTLKELPLASSMKLVVFAGGHLAKLVDTSEKRVFGFRSNWTDGPRGMRGDEKLTFEAWYRKNANGAWELDALYPTFWASVANLSLEAMVDGMVF